MELHEYILIPAFILSLILPHFKERKNIIICNIALVSIFFLAMFVQNLHIAMMVYLIAAIGGAAQLLIPVKDCKKTTLIRSGTSLITALLGSFLLFQTVSDLIIMAGFTSSRIAETQINPQNIRLFYILSATLYGVFAYINDINMMILAQTCLGISLLFSYINNHTNTASHIKGNIPIKVNNQ